MKKMKNFKLLFTLGFCLCLGFSYGQVKVLTNGDVGIGTSTPVCKLSVAGDMGVSGDIFFCGTLMGSAPPHCLSDSRLKENIQSVENSLDKIVLMNPVIYDFKESEYPELRLPKGKQYGLLAQELEHVLPELVSENKNLLGTEEQETKLKSVNYTGIISILIGALQELKTEADHKNQMMEDMSEKIAQLEMKLERLATDEGDTKTKPQE